MTPLGQCQQPVLFRNLVAHWNACTTWYPARLAETAEEMGDLEVAYRSTPDAMKSVDLDRIAQGTMSLVAFLRECGRDPQGPELYLPGLHFPKQGPLHQDVGYPDWLDPEDVFATSLFLGRNTKCIGHFHPKSHALLCQVQGKKRVRMIAPEEVHRASLFPWWSEGFFRSRINYYNDASQQLPMGITVHEYELLPGDALFIPLHWLHVPEGIGWNASLTHWWQPKLRHWPLARTTARSVAGIVCEIGRQLRHGRDLRSVGGR